MTKSLSSLFNALETAMVSLSIHASYQGISRKKYCLRIIFSNEWHINNCSNFLDHMDSGFGDCEIVNKCTAEKENATAGYKLYAGKT